MPVALDLPDISQVYARFIALAASSSSLGGSLLLSSPLDADEIAVTIASNIAGAALLCLEPHAERAKAALRSGVCDFVVNHLDEALRILKNEIRKRRAVSVILTADPDVVVPEIIERGVQPEIVSFAVPKLIERGSRLLSLQATDLLTPVTWTVECEAPRWLPILDAAAQESLAKKDARVRWIESAPRSLGRSYAGQRYLRMSDAEANAFLSATREAVHSGRIPVPVSVARGNETIRFQPISAAD